MQIFGKISTIEYSKINSNSFSGVVFLILDNTLIA